ncbi:MAG: DUF4173 domain-containing protein [Bacilli bacterium]|nr:DUF4173 domain-containing protein [Bacilli bacterium]
MGNLILYILIICIYNSILFFGKRLGLNVILFNIPLLLFMLYIFIKNKIIKNNKGLLFTIPIVLLSASYLVYDNIFFKIFNIIIIPLLFMLMYLYTIKESSTMKNLFTNIIKLIFLPFSHIGKLFKAISLKIDNVFKKSNISKSKILSVLIVIPVIIIILALLSSADMIFNNIFNNFFDILKKFSIDNFLGRLITMFILFIYLGSTISYLIFGFSKEEDKNINEHKIENFTIKLLLTSLNIIYIFFDFIQIRSLIFHQGLTNINYAEYARSGFFQLMFISVINIVIILLSKKSNKETRYNNAMGIIMILLTFVIIVSSFLRMYMYESAYGYTLLRLLVYVSLITETILLIPTLVYIINPKINILNYYVIITTIAYTTLSLSPVDYFIAKNNINRYHKTNKIDINYLVNESSDNIPLLYDYYSNLKGDKKQKEYLKGYFKYIYDKNKDNSIFEYNISRENAIKIFKKINMENNS